MRTAVVFVVVIALTAITTSLEACGGRIDGVECELDWVSKGGGRTGSSGVEPRERCVNAAGEETTPDGRRK